MRTVRDGFVHGGWSVSFADPDVVAAFGRPIAEATRAGGFLLGRRTYLDFYDVWPKRADGFAETLTGTPKYVASTTLTKPPPWDNSILLTDPVSQVADLKRDTALVVLGSTRLIQSLDRAGLIDEHVLTSHPLVLGQGLHLFASGQPFTSLTLISAPSMQTGVITPPAGARCADRSVAGRTQSSASSRLNGWACR
jgi:dihydrofolate reductase